MIRTTLTTAMLFLPLLMLQAAEHSTLDPNKLVAYYEFEATLLTIGHYATTKEVQMQRSRNSFLLRARNDILNPYRQEREARIWGGLSVCALSLGVAAWRTYFVIPA